MHAANGKSANCPHKSFVLILFYTVKALHTSGICRQNGPAASLGAQGRFRTLRSGCRSSNCRRSFRMRERLHAAIRLQSLIFGLSDSCAFQAPTAVAPPERGALLDCPVESCLPPLSVAPASKFCARYPVRVANGHLPESALAKRSAPFDEDIVGLRARRVKPFRAFAAKCEQCYAGFARGERPASWRQPAAPVSFAALLPGRCQQRSIFVLFSCAPRRKTARPCDGPFPTLDGAAKTPTLGPAGFSKKEPAIPNSC